MNSRILEHLKYDPLSGLFTRKKDNKVVGSKDKDGYIIITFKRKRYKAHRLAFYFVNGKLPKNQIDHINHIKCDNSFNNLREVTNYENHRNRKKNSNNTSGQTGVSFDKKCNLWIARISHKGKRFSLGMFVSYSEAVDARKNAEVLYGYHSNHGKG